MAIVKPQVRTGAYVRNVASGDLVAGGESVTPGALITAGAGTLTAAIITSGICVRTGPTGAYTDTTDTASNIIAAIPDCSPGDTFRFRHINTVAYAMTLAAGTGVTLGTVPPTTVQASLHKDYLVTVTNNTPTSVAVCNAVTGQKVYTGMTLAQTSAISVGMLVTGTSVGASSKVASIQAGVGFTADVNTSGTITLGAITFSPTVSIDAISMA